MRKKVKITSSSLGHCIRQVDHRSEFDEPVSESRFSVVCPNGIELDQKSGPQTRERQCAPMWAIIEKFLAEQASLDVWFLPERKRTLTG